MLISRSIFFPPYIIFLSLLVNIHKKLQFYLISIVLSINYFQLKYVEHKYSILTCLRNGNGHNTNEITRFIYVESFIYHWFYVHMYNYAFIIVLLNYICFTIRIELTWCPDPLNSVCNFWISSFQHWINFDFAIHLESFLFPGHDCN